MYAVSDGVRSTKNQDGGIVLDIEHGQMFHLNPVGAQILESLREGRSESDISNEIARQYGISEETALADLREFLGLMEQHHLVYEEQQGERS